MTDLELAPLANRTCAILENRAFQLTLGEPSIRLDRFLTLQPEIASANMSRTRLKTLIEAGHVMVNGATVVSANFMLRGGQTVSLDIPESAAPVPEGEKIPLKIVFEDAHIIVIDKPAGLVVHPAAGHGTGTLVNALISHCGESLSGIGGVKRPGIVHRLDKDTTGLLVAAKNDAAHRGLAKIFAGHGRTLPLLRQYEALVWGAPDRASGTVETFLGRHPAAREKIAVVPEDKGRAAITHWVKLREFNRSDKGALASLMECELETGRTHQIRVHMAHLGHPLLGDPLYGKGFLTKASLLPKKAKTALEKLGRQALHAKSLGFTHPITGKDLCFESPLPKDFSRLAGALDQGA